MGWEQRNGQRYYYRKKREGGRVVSEYVGTGEIAGLLFALDQSEYEERQKNRAEWKRRKDEAEKLAKDSKSLALFTRHILRACLLVKGYHPHKGQWRKKQNDR